MPSPQYIGRERRFIVTLRDGQAKNIRAENRDKARSKIAREMLGVRMDLDFKAACREIASCVLDPSEMLKRGPKGKRDRESINPNDHSAPHW